MQQECIYEIAPTDLYEVTFTTIQIWLAQVYQNTLRSPDYVLLSQEDYDAVVADLSRFTAWTPDKEVPLSKRAVYVANLAGGKSFHLAPLPDIPRNKAHAPAHLAFAQAGYTELPTLTNGNMIALVRRQQ